VWGCCHANTCSLCCNETPALQNAELPHRNKGRDGQKPSAVCGLLLLQAACVSGWLDRLHRTARERTPGPFPGHTLQYHQRNNDTVHTAARQG
jgi:hypothetical protein